MKLGIGLYGTNGHQVTHLLGGHPSAELTAVCGVPEAGLPEPPEGGAPACRYETLDDLLKDDRVRLVSLCSPVRAKQVQDALLCMKAGRHVYAEKPCALTERDLDALIEASARYGVRFHEMAGTAYDEPYASMAALIRAGRVGTVVQVYAQKSYPLHAGRPQDEAVDGGLIRQAGIHAVRMVEHVAGVRVTRVEAVETGLGNPVAGGGLKIAASLLMELENGGVASAAANYLNPAGFGLWGNETLRVFGTEGMAEAVDGGARTRLIVRDEDLGPIRTDPARKPYFDLIAESILTGAPPPMPMERELHCTRVVIRAKESAERNRLR